MKHSWGSKAEEGSPGTWEILTYSCDLSEVDFYDVVCFHVLYYLDTVIIDDE